MKKSTILIFSLLLLIGINSISIKKTFNTLNTERTLDDYKGTINIEKNVSDEKTTIIITIMHNGEEEIPEKISNLFEKGNEVVMDSLKNIDLGEEKVEQVAEQTPVEQKDVQDVAEEIKDVVAQDKVEGKTPEEIAEDVAEAIAEKAAEVAEQAGKEVTPEEVEEIAETLAEEVKDDLTPKQEEAVQEAVEELPQQVEEKVEQVAEQTPIPIPESGIIDQEQLPEQFSDQCNEIGPILSLLKQITSQAQSLLNSLKENPEYMSHYTQSTSLSQQQKSNLRSQNSALIEGYKTITNNMLSKLDETIVKVKEIEKESCAIQSIQEAQQTLQQVAAFLQLKH